MSGSSPPVVVAAGSADRTAPLVVLLHGRGSSEQDIVSLVQHLPAGRAYAAVRAPIAEGGGYAWFANRGIGRPVPESLRETMDWFRGWLDEVAPSGRPVVLVGFSGGAAFAGGLLLDDPGRYAGAAILYGTVPFDAGVPTTARLDARALGRGVQPLSGLPPVSTTSVRRSMRSCENRRRPHVGYATSLTCSASSGIPGAGYATSTSSRAQPERLIAASRAR